MDIFAKISQLTVSAEGVLKGLAIVIGVLAALKIIEWGKSVTTPRVILAVVVAGGVILVVQNPDLLTGDLKQTFSLPAPQQPPAAPVVLVDASAVLEVVPAL